MDALEIMHRPQHQEEETCRLAGEFARLTGESKTDAITTAPRERKRLRDADILARELRAIGRRCAELVGSGPSADQHGDVLYDERGMPG